MTVDREIKLIPEIPIRRIIRVTLSDLCVGDHVLFTGRENEVVNYKDMGKFITVQRTGDPGSWKIIVRQYSLDENGNLPSSGFVIKECTHHTSQDTRYNFKELSEFIDRYV